MKIQMINWFVKRLELNSLQASVQSSNEEKVKDKFSFSYGYGIDKENNAFQIGFVVDVLNPKFELKLEMIYNFKADTIIDEHFKDSPFIKINAPAIAFPYLRSFVSTLTMQSGYQCVILPSVNFVNLAKKNHED